MTNEDENMSIVKQQNLFSKYSTQLLMAALSGILLGLSQPLIISSISEKPLFESGLNALLIFFAWVPFLLIVQKVSLKRSYWLGVLMLTVKLTIVLYWLVIAMHVFGHIPLIVSIILLVALAFMLATALSAFLAGAKQIAEYYNLPYWLVFSIVFCGGEYLRNWGFWGGFPWGSDGAALASMPILLQGASVFGIYGLTMLILLVNGGLAELITYLLASPKGLFPKYAVLTAIFVFNLNLIYGLFVLNEAEEKPLKVVKVGLLQGNIDQGIKNKASMNRKTIAKVYHRLQANAVRADVDLVLWPEAAVPKGLNAQLKNLSSTVVLPKTGENKGLIPKAAIIGVSTYEREYVEGSSKPKVHIYNSAFATSEGLKVEARFDKTHLVPFGEYIPWPFDAIVAQIVPGGRTQAGADYQPISLKLGAHEVSVATTICYEGLFPEISKYYTENGAELMFNVTNDAWYGISSAAIQHFLIYAVRAVETGRPVVRVANTGYSGWIDHKGRVQQLSNLYKEQLLISEVPIYQKETLYLTFGDVIGKYSWIFALLLWFGTLIGPSAFVRSRKKIEWCIAAFFATVAGYIILSHFYLAPPGIDEAQATRNQFFFIASILIALGAFSGRSWGYKAQLWVSGIVALLCLVFLIVNPSVVLGFLLLIFVVVFILTKKRKDQYIRPAQTIAEFNMLKNK